MSETSYDQIPYPAYSFPESHPQHLAMLASLFGLQSPPPERASILELGCAAGANIIPIAWRLKNSRCVGVDLSSRQIESGQKLAVKLGIKNLQLSCLNLAEIKKDFGTFDYIICHGVFSWVPEEIQARILEICATNLSAQGVAYVSYNTLPGWNMYRSIRDMMLFHTRQFKEPQMIVGQARAFLDFASKAVSQQQSAYSLLLSSELERLRTQSDAYLFHDHLEVENNPVYFHDFMRRADAQGLRFLGEASFHSMSPSEFDPEVQQTLRSITDKIVAMEQYIDFLRNRTFRATLLCHRSVNLNRRIEPSAMKKYQVASILDPVSESPDIWTTAVEQYRHPSGTELRTGDVLTKATLAALKDVWPGWLPFERLLKNIRDSAAKSPAKNITIDEEALGQVLLTLFQQGLAELHLGAPGFVTKLSIRPMVSALARVQIQEGLEVTNLRHERVLLPDVFRQIAQYCDGSQDKAQLVASLEHAVKQGVLKMREGKEFPQAGPERAKYLSGIVSNALNFLSQSALLQQ